MKKRVQNMLSSIDVKLFSIVLLLNIISSAFTFLGEINLDVIGMITLVCISVFFTFIICVFSYLLKTNKKIQDLFKISVVGILMCLILIEVFLWLNFGILFDENIFSIIEGTNIKESYDFITTYFSITIIITLLSVIVLIITLYHFTTLLLNRAIIVKILVLFSVIFSLYKISTSVYSSIYYGFGGHLAAYSTFSRLGRAIFLHHKFKVETDCLVKNIQKMKSTTSVAKCDKIVVIIGESYSKYHSQLYGYEKNTTPNLNKKAKNNDIYVFTDVVTPFNDTERAIRAIYSLGAINDGAYSDYMLFPYAFKVAGWNTYNIDNMDLARNTSRVKDSRKLSNLMFDYRNDVTLQYDEEIIKIINNEKKSQSLYVIKLKGQHYTYADTFPSTYEQFSSEKDYINKNVSPAAKQMMADYDNSTLYNDYVVNAIIENFKDDNAVVIYFSDHGEEVYDVRNYMGHGGVSPYLSLQVEIPFIIWMSDKYKDNNPDIVENIIKNRGKPYTTDYVAHSILDMAGVSCPQFMPNRSVANNLFQIIDRRVVNYSLIYEDDIAHK